MVGKSILIAVLIIFVIHCLSLNFTQDDAFISYRYAQNLIEGKGLVFNEGERVEGYTNFLWIILLSFFAGLGLDMIVLSKILGIAFGCATLVLLHQISRPFFSERDWLLALGPSVLLTASSAFPYWSVSGLESAFFVAMVLLSVYSYLRDSPVWPMWCALTVLVRPEGALIFGLLFGHAVISRKARLVESSLRLGLFALLLLPFAIFKVLYYGNVLPNPFYAKTGLSLDYVRSGLEYSWLFLRHYGLWGLLYVLPVLSYRSLRSRERLLMLLVYAYTLYVIVIGGDVLKVHRFFLPILPLLYLLFFLCLRAVTVRFRTRIIRNTLVVASLLPPVLFFLVPHRWIYETRAVEKGLVEKMKFFAGYLEKSYGDGFSIAVTTIGSISYHLGTDVRVIDMLGLTDKYVSQHPEQITGIIVTWKERKYNSQYVLSQEPDFILFSTNYKPSAPAERALLLNSEFRQNYCVVPMVKEGTIFYPIFKRKGEYAKENQVFGDAQFVNLFYDAAHLHREGKYRAAIPQLKKVAELAPPDFAVVYELLGQCYFNLGDLAAAEEHLKKAIEISDCSVIARLYLVAVYQNTGRPVEAEAERKKALQYDPNFPW